MHKTGLKILLLLSNSIQRSVDFLQDFNFVKINCALINYTAKRSAYSIHSGAALPNPMQSMPAFPHTYIAKCEMPIAAILRSRDAHKPSSVLIDVTVRLGCHH